MLEDLEIGEAQAVEPAKLARKTEALPASIAQAWDATPIHEARRLPLGIAAGSDPVKVGGAILRLLRAYAKSQDLIAFKASATPTTDRGLLLYWQKKPGRVKPAILPMPSEPVTAKPKKGGGAT